MTEKDTNYKNFIPLLKIGKNEIYHIFEPRPERNNKTGSVIRTSDCKEKLKLN